MGKADIEMLVGYARVSTEEQSLDLQTDALSKVGCQKVFCDAGVSGSTTNRPALEEVLAYLTPGDVLVTWRLDRLGRSLSHLILLVTTLEQRGIGFRSLSEAIDTSSAPGRLMFHVLGALAEFERALIVERTKAGLAAAKQRGRALGRPCKLSAEDIDLVIRSAKFSKIALREIAIALSVSTSTVTRALRRRGVMLEQLCQR